MKKRNVFRSPEDTADAIRPLTERQIRKQMLEPGQDCSELQDLTVVFICMGDVIGAGRPICSRTQQLFQR